MEINYYLRMRVTTLENSFKQLNCILTSSHKLLLGVLAVFALLLTSVTSNAQFANVPVTGFNQDIVADLSGSAASASTTAAVDGVATGSFVFVTPTYQRVAATCVAAAGNGWPSTITSSNTTTNTGIIYNLQPPTSNNTLELSSTSPFTTSGTLTLVTPVSASSLYFVCLGGNGATTFNAQVNFSDATSQTISGLSAPDWCGGAATNKLPNATTPQIYYRLGRDAATCTGATCQYIYEIPATISGANYGKTITSITFSNTGTTFLHILAVGKQAPCLAPVSQPTALIQGVTTTSQIAASFTAASGSPSGYLTVRYPNGTVPSLLPVDGTTYSIGQGLGNGIVVQLSNALSFTASGLSGGSAYDFYLYSYSTGITCGGPVYLTTSPLTNTFSTNPCGTLTGTIPVGPTAPASPAGFPTLTAANAYINANGLGGATILELQTDYTTAYATANETFPITFPVNPCIGIARPLTIRPAAGVASVITLTSASTTATVLFDGGTYITIDGRNGGTGTNKFISITNTSSTAAAAGNAVVFRNESSNNLLTFLDLKASNLNPAINTGTITAGTVPGVVSFLSTTGLNGNDNNTVSFCDIHSATSAGNILNVGIYAYNATTLGALSNNDNNTITNCNIFDFFHATTTTAAFDIVAGNNNWNITSNSIYQTASRTYTTAVTNRGFWITPGASAVASSGFTITGNFIGGTAPSCGGTAYTMLGAITNVWLGMDISVGTLSSTNVYNNTIQNIAQTTTSTANPYFAGISVASGIVNVGNTVGTGNTIGSGTGTGSITLNATGSASFAYGIRLGGGTVVVANYNTVGSITINNGAISNNFGGIATVGGGTTSATINNNIIGSTTTASSIQTTGTGAAATAMGMSGIYVLSGPVLSTVNNNTIANLFSSYTGTTTTTNFGLRGIDLAVGANTISGNSVSKLSSASTATGSGNSSAVCGIVMRSTTAPTTISGNTIHTLKLTGASTTLAVQITGLFIGGPTTGTNTVSKNNIHSLSLTAANNAVTITGITVSAGTATYSNNMVRLGYDETGVSVTAGVQFRGITKGIAVVNNFYYNTIFIGGTGVVSSALNSFAFQRSTAQAAAPNDIIQNNIFVNNRSNASTGGKHYVFSAAVNTFLTLNYNVYYFTGTGGLFGLNVAADVPNYTINWVGGDANSIAGNPQFINPTGTAVTGDLHLNPSVASAAESGGIVIAGINDDYDGNIRQGSGGYSGTGTAPDIGADEYAGISGVPVINSLVILPSTTQCAAVIHGVTATVTAVLNPITSVVINYTINGVGQTPINMSLTSGSAAGTSVWDGNIPVVSPASATVVWSVTASDGTFFKTLAGGTYADAPQLLITPVVSASVNPVCSGSPTVLTLTPSFVSYSWTDGITTLGTTNPITVSPSLATTYTVTATHSSGCTLTASVLVNVNPLPSAPTVTPSTQCGVGIPAASVTSTSGLSGPQFFWYSASSGGSLLQTPPLGPPYYSNDFTSSTLVNSSLAGAASISGGLLALQPTATTTGGSLIVNASGVNTNQYQTDFDFRVIATGTQIADGFSYSFADDAIPTDNSTTPTAEHGSGSKLRLCFLTYNAASASDGKGIYLIYNTTATTGFTSSTPGVLAYSTNVSWIPTSATTITSHITASINTSGQLTLMLGATTIFSNVQLPAAFLSANKATWKYIFSSRSGGVAGGFGMDNLVIQNNSYVAGYTTYQSSISTPTTFYVVEKDPATGCESSPRAAVFANVTYGDTVVGAAKISGSPITALCLGNTFQLSTTQAASNNNYTYTWTASSTNSGISGSVSGGTSGSPTNVNVTPVVSGVYTFTLTYTDGTCSGVGTVTVTVNPLPSITSAVANPATICNGSSTTLTAQTGTSVVGTIGSGTGTSAGGSQLPYYRTFEGSHKQYLYTAAEFTTAGFLAGNFTNLTIPVASVTGTPLNFDNFGIRMANTSATSLTAFQTPTLTNCYSTSSTTPAAGNNSYTFTTPFTWDGTSNVLLDIYFDNDPNNTCSAGSPTCWGNSVTETVTTTAFTSCVIYYADNTTGARTISGINTLTTTSTLRPNFTFAGTNAGPGTYNWQWNPGAINSNVAIVSPTATTTYTVTATIPASGCTSTATASVTVIPIPSAPTGASSVQCGYGVPTASVTSTSGAATPVFKWYSAASGGTLLQSGTSNTYTTPINSTKTFYVTELVGICENSPRTVVTVTVNPADTVNIVTNDKTCVGTANPFSVTQVGSNQTYTSYSWYATPVSGSGVVGTPTGSTQTFAPTATGTYSYVVIASDGVCSAIDTQVVAVYVGLTGTATPTQITSCVNPTGLITANVSGAGTVVNNDFTNSTLPPYMTIQGSAAITGGKLQVTPSTSSQAGGVLIQNTTGLANNDFQVDFDFVTTASGGVGPADGLSYSYGDDAVIYPSGTGDGATTCAPENGSGTKLKLSFDAINNTGGCPANSNNGNVAGVYLMYNCTTIHQGSGITAGTSSCPGVLYFTNDVSWRATAGGGATTHVTIKINSLGQVSMLLNNVLVVNNVQLPASYLAADKSTWKHAFAARTGGGWEGHYIDNLLIQYNNFYEYSINGGSSWSQTNPIIPPSSGTYSVDARYVSVPGCFANLGSVTINAPSFTTATTQTNICAYSATQPTLSFSPSFGAGATYQWESSPAGMNSWSPVSGANSVSYTPAQGTIIVNTDFRCVISCSGTPIPGSPTSTITITPEAPMVTDTTPATRCGTGTVDLQANVTAGATAMWYTASSGGTSIGSGSPFTTPIITGTTTFYVSAASGSGCESGRTAVVATVTPAPTVTVSSPTTICEGDNTTLSASSTNDPNYVYTWNPGGFVGSSVIVTPSATTTYTLTALDNSAGVNNNCQDIKTVTIAVNQRPTINSLTSLPAALCQGDSAQISLTTTPFIPPSGNYTVTSIPFSPELGTMPNAGPAVGDETNVDAPLGFNFNYFGSTYNTVTIHSNGQILMGAGNTGANSIYTPPAIPSTAAPNNWVGVWADLYTSGSDITWGVVGVAPFRKLVINFTNVNYFSATPFITFQTVLNETYNTIDVHVTSTNGTVGLTRTIGVENSTGTLGTTAPGRTPGLWSAENESWEFAAPVVSSLTYSWSPSTGLSSSSIQNPKAAPNSNTVYTVTVNETGTGCSRTATLNINVSARPHPYLQEGDSILCSNDAGFYMHVLDNSAYSGGYPAGTTFDFYGAGGILYQSSTDNSFFNANNSDAFYAVVTLPGYLGSCTAISDTSVMDFGNTQAPQYLLTTDSVRCYGESNGKAMAEITFGGTPRFRWQWYNSSQVLVRDVTGASLSDTLSGMPEGMYTIVITDHQDSLTSPYCSITDSIFIGQPAAPLDVAENTGNHVDVLCNGALTGAIDIDVSGGTETYSYNWSNSAVTEDLAGIGAGTYTCTVTDSRGCTVVITRTITEPTALALNETVNQVQCNGGTGSVILNVTGGVASYSYEWSNSNSTASNTGLTSGTYTVTVTDGNGCTKSATFVIDTEPTAVTANCSSTPVSCFGGNNGTVGVTAGGGTPGYTYSWSNGSTSASQTSLVKGIYTVIVTDSHGCTASCSTTITQPTQLAVTTVAVNPTSGLPNSGTINVNATGGTPSYSYVWNNGSTVQNRTGLSAGTYTVTVTDANGCSASRVVTLTYTCQLGYINTIVTKPSCGKDNGVATVTGTGGTGYTYAWQTTPVQTTATATGLTYYFNSYVIITDVTTGCSILDTVVKPTSNGLTLTLTSPAYAGGKNIRCYGETNGSISLTVSGSTGPYTYLWNTGATTQNLTGVGAGTYIVTVSNGGCTNSNLITLTQPAALVATTTGVNVTCSGGSNGSATVTASGGSAPYNYSWNTSPVKTSATATGLTAGTYIVTVSDANGCTKTAVVTLTQPATGVSVSGVVTNVNCNGGTTGSIDITPSGGTPAYTYLWTGGVTTQDRINALAAGTYTVTVTDSKGCTGQYSNTITQPTAITATATTTNVNCNGGSNGTGSVTASGGTPPYTYSWNTVPPKSGANVNGIKKGTYTVIITDSKGCVKALTVTITEPAAIVIGISKTNVTTAGGSNGTATANVSGGVAPYSYSWNTVPVKTTQAATGLIAGTYTVTVTDANGCTKTASVVITQPTARMADGTQSDGASNSVVFPNPSTGKFTVTFDETIRTDVNLQVINMTGERVFMKDFDVSEQSSSFNIDLGALPKGIYFIRYRTNEKDWIDKLVIR